MCKVGVTCPYERVSGQTLQAPEVRVVFMKCKGWVRHAWEREEREEQVLPAPEVRVVFLECEAGRACSRLSGQGVSGMREPRAGSCQR